MNALCECPLAGFCKRHGVMKNVREHQLCRGLQCTPKQSRKYWDAWEAGILPGQFGAASAPKPFESQSPPRPVARGLGDWVSGQITRFTGVTPCGGCKQRAAWLNHFFPATLPPIEPVVLSNPTRHLMFHLWPVKGHGAWQWNCDQLLKYADRFNGRRIVAVVTDGASDSVDQVREYLSDFTDEILSFPNNARLREVVSFVPMLERLERYQSDQDLTFSCHGKCVRHNLSIENMTVGSSASILWTSAMYETLLSNFERDVGPLLTSHATVGSFRRYGTPQSGGWGLWHYSGTFFWLRNRDVFRRNWRYIPQRFYGTEAWPGIMFSPQESAVVFGDNIGDLYSLSYWNSHIEPQLQLWRNKSAQPAGWTL